MQDQAKNSDSNEKKNRGWSSHKHNKVDTTNKSQPRCKRQHKQTKFNDGRKSKINHKIIIYKNGKHNQTKQAKEGENDK